MIIVVGNGLGNPSSIPVRGWWSLLHGNTLEKDMKPSSFSLVDG